MEVISSSPTFTFDKIIDDFGGKLKVSTETQNGNQLEEEGSEQSGYPEIVSGENHREEDLEHVSEEEEEGEEEFEFSFVNQDGSPVSADDIFKDGQIQPMFPLFNRALLYSDEEDEREDKDSPIASFKKVFVKEDVATTSSGGAEELAEGTYCEWSSEKSTEVKKSNSTGFSRRWRFRDLIMHRSSSDGKDTFVFLNHNHSNNNHNSNTTSSSAKPNTNKGEKSVLVAAKAKTASSKSEIEKYVKRSKATKEGERRKSYLPYRPELVGFFASSTGFSRNIHPY